METSFKHLKNCDHKTIKIVNGYIHRVQTLFPWRENSYFIIPEMIHHFCLAFYWIRFTFNTEFIGDNLKIVDDKAVIKVQQNGHSMCAVGESISKDMCDVFKIEYL